MLWRSTADYLVLAQHDGTHMEVHGPAATVWGLMSEPIDHAVLVELVAREYHLRPDQLDGDVASLLSALNEAGYVGRSDA